MLRSVGSDPYTAEESATAHFPPGGVLVDPRVRRNEHDSSHLRVEEVS